MRYKVIVITLLLLPFKGIYANAIDFRVGGDMAELTFLTQTSSFGYGGADIGFGVLFNEHNDFIANGSILVVGSSGGDLKALQFGVGAKAYGGVIKGPNGDQDINGGAVAIGGGLRYVFSSKMPVAVLGEIFFAPEVTSISEFDGLLEYRLGLELEITPSARAYIGYRKLEVKFNSSVHYDVDDSAHVGVRFEF